MARRIICGLLMLSSYSKALSSFVQPTIQQYLQLAGAPQTRTITIPAAQTAPQITTQPRPPTGLTSFSALALPNLVSSLQQLPNQAKPTECKHGSSSIDANLLNNLAIALQLLVVSNILNAPPPEDSAKVGKEIRSCSEPMPNYPQYEAPMPSANFVGSSSFAEPNLGQVYKPTRNSMSLMSPYEALRTSSYSDPGVSHYGPSNPRQDFQSPYAMIDKDLFSMNDLF